MLEPVVTNKPQGSGLGLAIVREIVKQHKGTVHTQPSGERELRFTSSFLSKWGKPSNGQHVPAFVVLNRQKNRLFWQLFTEDSAN